MSEVNHKSELENQADIIKQANLVAEKHQELLKKTEWFDKAKKNN